MLDAVAAAVAPSAAAAASATTAGAASSATPNGDVDGPGLQRKGSLPPRLASKDAKDGAEDDKSERLNTVAELPSATADADKKDAAARGKRASLPIITPDLYKQTKNLILDKTTKPRSSLSPKFERLRNEVSPLEEVDKCTQNEANGGETGGASESEGGAEDDAGKVAPLGDARPPSGSQYENKAFVAADQAAS